MENKELPLNQIIQGNCIEVLKTFPENSIDCVVTDPPYGLSFMGKEWDKALPPKEAFIEMCRVLKPRALAFVMSSPRQDLMCRMGILLEDSGFDLGQSFISWIYASGFPKAYDVSKGIDSRLGANREITGTRISAFGNTELSESEDGRNLWGKSSTKEVVLQNNPSSDEAKKHEGWKSVTGLKPALEVIFMVQKPLSEKTIVDNVLKWGTGAMNVDACRIPFEANGGYDYNNGPGGSEPHHMQRGEKHGLYDIPVSNHSGRFPANLLVSGDALNDGKVRPKAGNKTETHNAQESTGDLAYHKGLGGFTLRNTYGTVDSFSRYFDLDAWAKHHGILEVPKASTNERDMGLTGEKKNLRYEDGRSHSYEIFSNTYTAVSGNPSNRGQSPQHINNHPTVKPIKLGAYLCELGCPPKGIVLDPFCGSGSFCVSAKIMGKVYIGIELDIEYYKIASERIKNDISEYREIIEKVRPEKPSDKKNVAEMFG